MERGDYLGMEIEAGFICSQTRDYLVPSATPRNCKWPMESLPSVFCGSVALPTHGFKKLYLPKQRTFLKF